METWYRAMFGRIDAVDVHRATDKFVVLDDGLRSAMDSAGIWYRRDREQVKAAMIAYQEKVVSQAKLRLKYAEEQLQMAQNA